jgi:hypothetical protein
MVRRYGRQRQDDTVDRESVDTDRESTGKTIKFGQPWKGEREEREWVTYKCAGRVKRKKKREKTHMAHR